MLTPIIVDFFLIILGILQTVASDYNSNSVKENYKPISAQSRLSSEHLLLDHVYQAVIAVRL